MVTHLFMRYVCFYNCSFAFSSQTSILELTTIIALTISISATRISCPHNMVNYIAISIELSKCVIKCKEQECRYPLILARLLVMAPLLGCHRMLPLNDITFVLGQ